MAVLVQPHLEPRLSGVLFGLDPLSGRRDRRVVVAVNGGPQRLVSGEVDGTRYLLGPRGRLVDRTGERLSLTGRNRRALADLAREAALLFGSPQDIEWALDENGCLWLLQSRPVTAAAAPAAVRGPVLGPGPVAETFPDPLGPLEEDLWVPPLRLALTESLHLTGAASRRRLASSSLVVTVEGRLSVDLGLLGALPGPRSPWSRLDPRPPFRRLRAAWTVGRLRAALPGLAASVTASVDAELTAVPALGGLPDDALLLLLRRAGDALVAVHGYEMLAGLLPAPTRSAASVALDALAVGRAEGLADPDAVAARPIVLALLPPSITVASRLPAGRPALGGDMSSSQLRLDDLAPREALRLRARWLHELDVRVALELGRRLAVRGLLEGPGDVGLLSLAELEAAVRDGTAPTSGDGRRLRLSPPLPAAFRLAPDGAVVAVVPAGKRRSRRARRARAKATVSPRAGGRDPSTPARCRRRRDPCSSWPRSTPGWPPTSPAWPAWWPRRAACCRTSPSSPGSSGSLASSAFRGRSGGSRPARPWWSTAPPARSPPSMRSGHESLRPGRRRAGRRHLRRLHPRLPVPLGVAPGHPRRRVPGGGRSGPGDRRLVAAPGRPRPPADGGCRGGARRPQPAGARPGAPEILVHLREAAPEPRPPFAWLEPDRLGVFLPILLGAGVLASAAAWVVEALARKTARPALERRLAARLEVFALPAGGLLGPGPAEPVRRARRAPAWPVRLGLMTLAVFGGAVGIDELADATQTRPDSVRAGVHTVVELQLHGELAQAAPARMAASLWHTCEGALRRDLPEPVVTDLGGARVQLALPVDIGTHALRRLHGCLEDAAFDRVQAGVTVRMVSAPG